MTTRRRARRNADDGTRDLRLPSDGPDRIRDAFIHAIFLWLLERDVPAALADLAAVRHEPDASAVCGRWARRWRLCGPDGRPVAWVVSAAMDSLEMWRAHPVTAGRAFDYPSGGAWWDEGGGPKRKGSAAWRQLEPLRWLVLRVCGDLGAAKIAETCGGLDRQVVKREVRRQAKALGIRLVPRPAGRPRRSDRE